MASESTVLVHERIERLYAQVNATLEARGLIWSQAMKMWLSPQMQKDLNAFGRFMEKENKHGE